MSLGELHVNSKLKTDSQYSIPTPQSSSDSWHENGVSTIDKDETSYFSSPNTKQVEAEPIEIDGRDNIYALAYDADGKLVSGGREGKIRRWQVEDGDEAGKPIDARSRVWTMVVSRDGKWIVAGTETGVTVWDAVSHEKLTEFRHRTQKKAGVCIVDLSPDKKKVGTGSEDGTVCVWILSTAKLLFGPWTPHSDKAVVAKFSPNGDFFAAGWGREFIRIHDSYDGRLLFHIPIRISWLNNMSIAWTNDSRQFFVLSYDGYINCLDVSDGTTLSKWRIHSDGIPRCTALASNGTFLVASDKSSISFWDTTTHERVGSVYLPDHTAISCMGLSANYDLVISGNRKIILRNLRDLLPPQYFDSYQTILERDISRARAEKADLEEAIQTLRVQDERSNEKIANLEKTVQQLSSELVDSQHATQQAKDSMDESLREHETNSTNLKRTIQDLQTQLVNAQRVAKQANDSLNETVTSLRAQLHLQNTSSADSLINIVDAHEHKHRCMALYADGRIIDAAVLFIEVAGTISEEAKADTSIISWISEFTAQCITSLEIFGDVASSNQKDDEALTAYATALSLGPSNTNTLLIKWASKMSLHHSVNEVLGTATKFAYSRFDAYRAICDALLEDKHVQDAIGCFRQMQRELIADKSDHDKRAQWDLNFLPRCREKLRIFGDIAMNSHKYNEAIEYFSTLLSLDPDDRMEILIDRSKAKASVELWEDALSDADEATKLDPSSHRGYEARHAVLHGAKRYAEAVEAFNLMLSKLESSPDQHVRELCRQYVDARPEIRSIVDDITRHTPRVLIDTISGSLCDKRQQTEAFEALPIYNELVSSMIKELDDARIRREVKEFYRYAMLSHKWGDGEPLLQDVEHISVYKLETSPANTKLQSFCSLSDSLGFRWAWSDTCCIDKVNNVVLQESLVAMFRWYRGSDLTVVHLLGVFSHSQGPGDLRGSIWNTRAWTYQEYLAAQTIQFYTADWKPYLGLMMWNHKDSSTVVSEMEQASGASANTMAVLRPGLDRAREKLYLASSRQTTLVEDMAYSLLGIFSAAIPVIYGEGKRAVGRFLEYVLSGSGDVTILAWTGTAGTYNSCLPEDVRVYNHLVPRHIPSPIETTELDQIVTELRISFADITPVMKLYDSLTGLSAPSMVASRLHLPGIVFDLTELVQVSGPDPVTHVRVYHATTFACGDVKIETVDDLTHIKDLCIVHPWIRSLLDQEFSSGRSALDKTTRAFRLIARLRQPFGALLFMPISRTEYKRIAADSFIEVQIREEVPLADLRDSIQTMEVYQSES